MLWKQLLPGLKRKRKRTEALQQVCYWEEMIVQMIVKQIVHLCLETGKNMFNSTQQWFTAVGLQT